MMEGWGILVSAIACGYMMMASSCYKGDDYVVLIRKGDHSDDRFPYLWVNKKKMEFDITFTESCRYNLGTDQSDQNKLFGIGYSPGHRMNSVRFGWFYNPTLDCIEISAYTYEDGVRYILQMAKVAIGETNRYVLTIDGDRHDLEVVGKARNRVMTKSSAFSYMLHPYFGGNQPAPHHIYIKMTRP
jgi:hypothetical protein